MIHDALYAEDSAVGCTAAVTAVHVTRVTWVVVGCVTRMFQNELILRSIQQSPYFVFLILLSIHSTYKDTAIKYYSYAVTLLRAIVHIICARSPASSVVWGSHTSDRPCPNPAGIGCIRLGVGYMT